MEDKDFIIDIGPLGTFNKSGAYQTLPEHIDAIFADWAVSKPQKITLFFHGGLVNERDGLGKARFLAPYISSATNAPVCFVWETGLIETVTANIQKIGDTALFEKVRNALIKTLFKDSLNMKGAGIALTDQEINIELQKNQPFERFGIGTDAAMAKTTSGSAVAFTDNEKQLRNKLYPELEAIINEDKDFVAIIQRTTISDKRGDTTVTKKGFFDIVGFIEKVFSIALRVAQRLYRKTDHGFYPTIVEETLREIYVADLGAWIWDEMKVKSDQMWKSNKNRKELNQYVGRYFLDRLALHFADNQHTEINLVGHSAGSIAICNLLKTAAEAHPFLSFNHIVYMAPACRTDLFQKQLENVRNRCKDIRVFTMSDQFEREDVLVPFLYTRSLLYFISGVLEEGGEASDAHLLGLERHIDAMTPYDGDAVLKEIHTYLYEEGSNRLVFSKTASTALTGLQASCEHHGGFVENEHMLKSMLHIISH